MASALRSRTIVSHERVKEICEKIKEYINQEHFFKNVAFTYEFATSNMSRLHIVLRLNPDTFCSAMYIPNKNSQLDHTHIHFVNSTLGHYTGVFLLNIQLLICYLSHIHEVTLDNFTNDQVRAARGIYKRFEVNERGYPHNEFIGKNLASKLHTSEGEMRLRMTSDLRDMIYSDLRDISKKVSMESNTNPWNPDYTGRLSRFLGKLGETFGGFRKKNLRNSRKRYIKKRHTRKR
uniref:Uncharacterized protein n=1 Tax=viral metagenome TaxID=1070528 RepID=A0A6C0KV71_9ZZZZ